MFTELCSTGRVNRLDIVHRFTNPWEGAASLRLRNGDIRALDLYEAHDRIIPGSLDEHLATIAEHWTTARADGTTLAVTTTRNDYVDQINGAIQQRRLALGHLDPRLSVEIADGAHAYVGDVIATRRNDRRLTTTDGDTVRNRGLWTITALGHDGGLTVTHIDGHSAVTLPAAYVNGHVRLGYATTEPGNQGTTTHASQTLVTDATTGRGLYVGATRGRTDNTILVVTGDHDPGHARDVLERVLSYDRADLPAIVQRQALSTQLPPIVQPVLTPRCSIPEWVGDLRAETMTEWQSARARVEDDTAGRERLVDKLRDASAAHKRAETAHTPFARAINTALDELDHAKTARNAAHKAVGGSSIFGRRAAKQHLAIADDRVADAATALEVARAVGGPTAVQRNRTALKVRELDDDLSTHDTLQRFNNALGRQQAAEVELDAIDAWRQWAEGRPITAEQTIGLIETINDLATDYRTANTWNALAVPVRTWAEHRGIDLPTPSRHLSRDTIDFGIGL